MKISTARKKIALTDKEIDELYVDPMRLAINRTFGKIGGDYRNDSIDLCLKWRVPFSSETNTAFDVMERVLRVKCPYCHKIMKTNTGGGCSHTETVNYVCKCGAEVSVTIPKDGINIRPKEEIGEK